MRNLRNVAWDAAVLDAKRLVARAQKCQLYQDCDGFDDYTTASQRWTVNGTAPTYSSAYARFAPPSGLPGLGIYMPALSYMTRTLQSNQATLIGKVAYYPLAYHGAGVGATAIMGFDNSNPNTLTALTFHASGAVQLWTQWQSPYAVLRYASGPSVMSPLNWYGVEWLVTLDSSGAGVLKVWVNGFQLINASGLVTCPSGMTYGNRVWLADNSCPGVYFDDFRVWDNTGSTQNAPLGTDSRLVTKVPSGVGAATNFTPNGAAANWQCVDDIPPDDDTTYVSGAASGLIDSYAMPSAGFTAAPSMVVARSRVRKDDGATRSLNIGVSSSGAVGVGSSIVAGSTYANVDSCIALDPNTSAAWAAAAADAAQHYKQETA